MEEQTHQRQNTCTHIDRQEQIVPGDLWFVQADAEFDPRQLVKTDVDTHAVPLEVSDLGTLDKDLLVLLTRLTNK